MSKFMDQQLTGGGIGWLLSSGIESVAECGSHVEIDLAIGAGHCECTSRFATPRFSCDLSQWLKARVNIDYHVALDGNWYSVPYTLNGEEVELRSTPATVEIFHHGKRVASHLRSRERNKAVTQNEHRPKSHQAHLEWPPSRMVNWAGKVGPNTAQLVQRILDDKPHPEMGYRACLGIIRLAAKYSLTRMEHAAERAVLTGAVSYKSVKSILHNGLDSQPPASPPPTRPSPEHENLRGPEYFQ